MNNKYYISEYQLRKAVKSCTRNLMANQKNWKKDKSLNLLEFQIEGILTENLNGYHGIIIK